MVDVVDVLVVDVLVVEVDVDVVDVEVVVGAASGGASVVGGGSVVDGGSLVVGGGAVVVGADGGFVGGGGAGLVGEDDVVVVGSSGRVVAVEDVEDVELVLVEDDGVEADERPVDRESARAASEASAGPEPVRAVARPRRAAVVLVVPALSRSDRADRPAARPPRSAATCGSGSRAVATASWSRPRSPGSPPTSAPPTPNATTVTRAAPARVATRRARPPAAGGSSASASASTTAAGAAGDAGASWRRIDSRRRWARASSIGGGCGARAGLGVGIGAPGGYHRPSRACTHPSGGWPRCHWSSASNHQSEIDWFTVRSPLGNWSER
ncbi:MAG TPA: hypothetical protein VIL48_16920 [Acidimicrobiales bacterium]